MGRRQSLQHTVTPSECVFRSAGNDDPELRRDNIEPLGSVLTDQNLFQPLAFFGDFRLDDLLDTFEMGGKAFARARLPLRPVFPGLVELAVDRCQAGLDFLERKVDLIVVDPQPQPFRARALLGPLKHFHNRSEGGDPLVSVLL